MKNDIYARSAVVVFMAIAVTFGIASIASAQDSGSTQVISDKSPTGELDFWNKIKDSKNKSDFQTYMLNFPNGMFFDPAMQKYLEAGGSKSDLSTGKGTAAKKIETVTPPDNTVVTPPTIKSKQVTKTTRKKVVVKSRVKSKKKIFTRVKRAKIVSCGKGSVYYRGSCHLKTKSTAKFAKGKKPTQVNPLDVGGGGGGGGGRGGGWGH